MVKHTHTQTKRWPTPLLSCCGSMPSPRPRPKAARLGPRTLIPSAPSLCPPTQMVPTTLASLSTAHRDHWTQATEPTPSLCHKPSSHLTHTHTNKTNPYVPEVTVASAVLYNCYYLSVYGCMSNTFLKEDEGQAVGWGGRIDSFAGFCYMMFGTGRVQFSLMSTSDQMSPTEQSVPYYHALAADVISWAPFLCVPFILPICC